jgi:hypothetical protein
MGILKFFKKKQKSAEQFLELIDVDRGLLWEAIADFKENLQTINGAVTHHTDDMQKEFPVTHHIKDGLYTRELFMPKGSLVVSFIHLTNHPSFFLKGEMSLLIDTGEIKRIKAPMVVQTEAGTQRVAYMHEDCIWSCVYKTDKETVEEAEKDIYTENYMDLPEHIIFKKQLICQG